MKAIAKFVVRLVVTGKLCNLVTPLWFVPKTTSYFIADCAIFIALYTLLEWAFEVKVADIMFEGKKVGEMKERE
ncbi:MAG TPA: hypothetical protein VGD26_13925 [Chitinophagaceae bacterium]